MDYLSLSESIRRAMEIAIEVVNESEHFNKPEKSQIISLINQFYSELMNPEPKFRNVKSLKYIQSDFLTFFLQIADEDEQIFWRKLRESGVVLKPERNLNKILASGRLKNVHEFNFIVDFIVSAEQSGEITSEEAIRLNSMMHDFEKKSLK